MRLDIVSAILTYLMLKSIGFGNRTFISFSLFGRPFEIIVCSFLPKQGMVLVHSLCPVGLTGL